MIEIIKDRNDDGEQDLGNVAEKLDVVTLLDDLINPLLQQHSVKFLCRDSVRPSRTWNSRIRKPVRTTVRREMNMTGAVTKYLQDVASLNLLLSSV